LYQLKASNENINSPFYPCPCGPAAAIGEVGLLGFRLQSHPKLVHDRLIEGNSKISLICNYREYFSLNLLDSYVKVMTTVVQYYAHNELMMQYPNKNLNITDLKYCRFA
jgi:hypothetical protein